MELTKHQKNKLDELLTCGSKLVQLTGSPGVGKTRTIAEFVKSTDWSVELTATTNKAVANLIEMADIDTNTGTIHKWLGFTMVHGNLVRKRTEPRSYTDVLIVDESSMLTRDIMIAIQEACDSGHIRNKAILVGDPVQLNIDPMLNLEMIPAFELTIQMRQIEENTLTEVLADIRKRIESKSEPQRINDDGISVVRHDSHESFLKAYKNSNEEKIILAYKNQTVRSYNNSIIKLLHKKPSKYNDGDYITATGPVFKNGKMVIHNRQTVLVIEAQEYPYTYHVKIEHVGWIEIPKSKAWLDRELQGYLNAKDWSKYYELKESYLFCHHAYCGTTHSAQGISVDEVFIDVGDFNPPNDPLYITLHRLLYVSASRARKRIHFYTGVERNFECLKG